LDSFGQAFTSWITRDVTALGGSVTIFNSNAVSSAQLNDIDTAIATGQYSGIIWQPNDPTSALTTIKAIQADKLPQVVFDSSLTPGQGGVTVPQLLVNLKTADTAIGVAAAEYIKAHPALGAHPEAVWMGISPPQYVCTTREQSFLNGLRSVDPQAKIVGNLAAVSIADADSKMSDFITRGVKFNAFLGCGPSPSDGGIAAIKSAGLAGVRPGSTSSVNKVPANVWMAAESGDTLEYQELWSSNVALMAVNLQGPKTAADDSVHMLVQEIEGKIGINSAAEETTPWTPLYTNCQQDRQAVLQQYQGVKGFSIPSCP
jgi:ABC-type sugar transport system substrate-binding protein